jgi:hypothetical protein
MKGDDPMRLATIAAVAAACVLAAQAVAQSTSPATGSPAMAPAAQEPARTASATDRPVEGANDPRRCLEYSTNLEIHTCAEKFRPRKRST